jgi:hypothetical protein
MALKIQLILALAILILLVSGCVETNRSTQYDPPEPVKTEKPELDIDKVSRIATQVASEHEYDEERYNCVNFSKELVRRLKLANYSAHTVTGYKNNEPHMWVEIKKPFIRIEATTGEFISDRKYKSSYSLTKIRIPVIKKYR